MLDTSRQVRDGGHPVQVDNSGLEVWLYDDANLAAIRRDAGQGCGGMPGNFDALSASGMVVGYSLLQDDEIDVVVYTGAPLTAQELSVSRWLEPQTAFLSLPSGTLCIESNDVSRIGPQEPGEQGARVRVPAGDYRLTLYRIDHEALDREGLEWDGPQEVIVLTPGGTAADAATELLPFEQRRDLSWVGRYSIQGRRADALVWLGDYWDTFVLNLDAAAATKLGLAPGAYIRTTVRAAGLTMISAFADSWAEAKRLPPPAGVSLDEYGLAAFCEMGDWNGQQALFCKRDTAKKKAGEKYQTQWLPAVVEVLDAAPQPVVPVAEGLRKTDLRAKPFFDSGLLAMILSDVLTDGEPLDGLELSRALDMLGEQLAPAKLSAVGDVGFEQSDGPLSIDTSARLYAGLPDMFVAALVTEATFHVIAASELANGDWIVTGLADDLPSSSPRVSIEDIDEPLANILNAHRRRIKKAKVAAAPSGFEEAAAAFGRLLEAMHG